MPWRGEVIPIHELHEKVFTLSGRLTQRLLLWAEVEHQFAVSKSLLENGRADVYHVVALVALAFAFASRIGEPRCRSNHFFSKRRREHRGGKCMWRRGRGLRVDRTLPHETLLAAVNSHQVRAVDQRHKRADRRDQLER